MGIFNEADVLATENYVTTVSGDVVSQIITDHGELAGLDSDDHNQYIRTDGSRGFTATVSGVTPVLDNDLVTLQYLEERIDPTASGSVGNIIFGSEFTYIEDDAISSTNSTAWQNKLTLTTPTAIPAGSYRVGFYYLWSHSKSNTQFLGRVIFDDSIILFSQDSRVSRVDYYLVTSGFYYYENAGEGIHHIDIEYASTDTGSTSYIKEARLEFWRVI